MKFNCDRYKVYMRDAYKHLTDWHPHFALIPRKVGEGDCRWLETIERKGEYHTLGYMMSSWWTWEYRVREKEHRNEGT